VTAVAAKTKKAPELITEFRGETIEIPTRQGRILEAAYNAAKAQLEEAKQVMKDAENAVKTAMKGHEALLIDGETVFTWKFVNTTSFQTAKFKQENPGVYELYLKHGQTRRFVQLDKI